MQNEKELITLAKAGDPQAFRDLVVMHQRSIMAFAYDLTGNQSDAEDLAQEVFIKMYQSIKKFRGDAKLYSWLYRITLNCRINQTRSKNFTIKKRKVELQDNLHADSQSNPEETAAHNLMQDHLKNALNKLSPKERAVFALKHYQEYKLAEISEALQISVGTVKSLLFRGIKKLQKELTFYQEAS